MKVKRSKERLLNARRKITEEFVNSRLSSIKKTPAADARSLVGHLLIRLLELEMQNQELRRRQLALGAEENKYSAVNNITARIQAEDELWKCEVKYRALVEMTDMGYVVLDENGKVIEANGEYLRQTGRQRLEDIQGRSVLGWTAGDEKGENTQLVQKCIDEGFLKNFDVDLVDENGKTTPIQMNAATIQTEDGLRIVGFCQDISYRRQVERENLKAQKLMSFDVVACGTAHDFNNLMASVVGNISLAKMELKPGSKAVGYLVEAEKACIRTKALTTRLVRFSKGGDPVTEGGGFSAKGFADMSA